MAVEFSLVQATASEFLGEITQLPPMYSAIKKDGVRLYELARQGVEVERTPRKCEIYSLSVGDLGNGEFSLECECSSGTYIRTLISDIGERLGCGATMTSLERTYACGINLSECYTLEEVSEFQEKGELDKIVIELDKLLSDYPEVHVTENQAKRFSNGGSLMRERVKGLGENGLYRAPSVGDRLSRSRNRRARHRRGRARGPEASPLLSRDLQLPPYQDIL